MRVAVDGSGDQQAPGGVDDRYRSVVVRPDHRLDAAVAHHEVGDARLTVDRVEHPPCTNAQGVGHEPACAGNRRHSADDQISRTGASTSTPGSDRAIVDFTTISPLAVCTR